jgi:hypothetical protein
MLGIIKKSMRITHDQLDDVLLSDIYAGADELERVGINPYATEDGEYKTDEDGNRVITDRPLIRKTIELYVKAVEDFDGKGTRYMSSFKASRDSMSLSMGYNKGGCNEE